MIYFDHAAATPVLPEVRRALPELLRRNFANPEAAHGLAHTMRRELAGAARQLSKNIFPDAETAVIWGGSASELFALLGAAAARPRARAGWGSPLDHPAAGAMLRNHFRDTMSMKLSPDGRIAGIPESETPPELAVFTWVQSELGVVQDLSALGAAFRAMYPDALLVADLVQGAGKLTYPAAAPLPDIAVISGHKFGAPGGAALLLATPRGRRMAADFEQLRHRDYRTGRVEPATALALALALKVRAARYESDLQEVTAVNTFLRDSLTGMKLPNGATLRLTVPAESASPYILHMILPGYQSGVLVRMFSQANIMLAAGSACQSESAAPSAAMTALGFDKNTAYSGLRLSFAPENTLVEAHTFLAELRRILKNY